MSGYKAISGLEKEFSLPYSRGSDPSLISLSL